MIISSSVCRSRSDVLSEGVGTQHSACETANINLPHRNVGGQRGTEIDARWGPLRDVSDVWLIRAGCLLELFFSPNFLFLARAEEGL